MINKILPYIGLTALILYTIHLIVSPSIQLNITASSASILNITDEDNKPVHLTKTTVATNNKLTITNVNKKNTKSKGNEIFFTPVKTEHNGQISKTDSYKAKGDWKTKGDLQNSGKWYSTTPNSIITFEGYTSNLNVSFIKHPYSGTANINWNGQDMGDIDLYSENETLKNIKLENPKSNFYSLISPKTRELHFDFQKQNSTIDEIQLIFGNQIILQESNIDSNILKIDNYIQIKIIFILIKSIIVFIFKILLLSSIYLIIGLPFVIPIRKLSSLQKIVISIITGLAFVLLINTTLCFFFPVNISLPIFLVLISSIYLWSIKKNDLLKLVKSETRHPIIDKNFIFLFTTGILSVIIVFFPAIIEPNWFFGHSYTDSFEYTNLSQIFITTSPREYGFWLEVLRFAETIFLSINSLLLQTTTLSAYAISAAVFWFQLPFLSYLILKKILLNNTPTILLGTLMFSFSANLYSLFSQSYLAQYFFAFSLIYGILISILLLDFYNKTKKKDLFFILIVNSILFTTSLVLYSYHFFLPISLFLTGASYLIFKRSFYLLKLILLLGTMIFILLNINSIQIINFSKTSKFNEQLNNIGRHTVFPFYKDPIVFGSKILGLDDLVQNSPQISRINNELYGPNNNLNYIFNSYLYKIKKIILLASVFFSLFGILYSLLKRKGPQLFLFFTSLTYLSVLFYLFKLDQIYPFGKLGLTLGIILLINILLGINFILHIFKNNKIIQFTLNTFLCSFIFLNILTIFVDNSLFYLNRNSLLLYELRSHVSTVNIEVKQFETFINSKKIKKNSSFLIIGSYDDVYKTDKDRVFNNRILQILNNHNVNYSTNSNTHVYYGYDFGYNELPNNSTMEKNDYILVFNGYQIDKKNDHEIVFENNIFKVYKNNN